MGKLTIDQLSIKGKRVFLRVDFNVHIQKNRVVDAYRIEKALPSIRKILDEGGSLVLASHRGRPGGEPRADMSLHPVVEELGQHLKQEITLSPAPVGAETAHLAKTLQPRELLLLENLRFHPGERANQDDFARELASYADLYVNDAFGTAHRSHASTVGVPRCFSKPAAGYLIAEEMRVLGRVRNQPNRPLALLVGGSKVSDKVALLSAMVDKIDYILLGGAMAYGFLAAQGRGVGDSFVEPGHEEAARSLLETIRGRSHITLLVPEDHAIERPDAPGESHQITDGPEIPKGWRGVDIGPKTIKRFREALADVKMVIWNGPLGVFERSPFDWGTREVAKVIAELPCESIVGGGETSTALRLLNLENRMSHVSTGGGACLTFLSGHPLPAIEALADQTG